MRNGSKTKPFHGFGKIALFCCLFAAVFLACQSVLNLRFGEDACVTKRYELYRQEPANSIDMLIVGSSQLFWGIAPTVMWEAEGFTSVNFSSERQTAIIAYYRLKMLLEMNTPPKYVLFDMNDLSRDNSATDEFFEAAFYHFLRDIPSLTGRLEFIHAIVSNTASQSYTKYLFPLVRFHSRWPLLNKNDFGGGVDYDALYEDYRKGVLPQQRITDVTEAENVYQTVLAQHTPKSEANYNELSLKYWEKTLALCEENDIQPVVLIARRYDRVDAPKSLDEADQLMAFCDEHGIPYIDHNDQSFYDELRLDPKLDFRDEGHVNQVGLFKFSEGVAWQLRQLLDDLPDHRGDPDYDNWDIWSEEFRDAYQPE